jgi:CHAD domain-containing protein
MDVAAQHAVRKRLKRLRYLTELVRSLYPAGKVARLLEALEPAQEALGARTDLLLAIELASDRAQAHGGPAWFNVGWLTAQLPASAKRCRQALARAVKVRSYW